MKIQFIKTIVLGITLLGLMACATKKGGSGREDELGVGDTVRFYGTNVSPEQERQLLAQRTYYFGYDQFEVKEEDMLSLYAHAKRLIKSPRSRVRVAGHTDERGSREYNIALGERRGNAIANILMLKGVNQNQISVVSFGKEKPEELGSSESAWARNRRAEIVYEVE